MRKKLVRVLVLVISVSLMSCAHLRIPTIQDGARLGARPVPAPEQKYQFASYEGALPDFSEWGNKKSVTKYGSLEKMLESSNTTAFLVVQDGKLVYEHYANGVNVGDVTQVFSVTKVFVTTMLGIAIQEGYIKSLDQPVSDFLPEFAKGRKSKITLFHLAQMQSGIDYDEYHKILQTLKFYYAKDTKNRVLESKIKKEPGTSFKYKSIDTQILGMCIEKAVGRDFMEYFYEKLWSKLKPEDAAYWSIDSKESNQLKYYGGLNTSARDLAKFGLLLLNNGFYDGQQVLNPLTLSLCKDKSCRNDEGNYCNGWWYDQWDSKNDIFYGAGFNGQVLLINRTTNTVIVRLGKNKGGESWYSMMKKLTIALNADHKDNNHLLITQER